ncbi:hypothetical protein [Acidovorax sp. A79]|uniref:hypothetical protein n=1 Tax=Acidovorax sp. A79 TaxID=3056107 RepID=UPI0034E87222
MTSAFRPRPATRPHALRGAGQGARGQKRGSRRLPSQVVRLALAWLLLALVAVPTLGRLHQVVHGGALDRVHAGQALSSAASAASIAPGAAPSASGHGLLLPLLLGHHAPVDCLVLDQLALGDALHSAPLALPHAVPAQAPSTDPAGRVAVAHVALFQARGPPGRA